ncbi:hypothetical protein GCM10010193_40480 [Kitasatospora atroaurantiaca]|uniref:hypothetical protein n=1 Tax=Kitasatospora atroaurantiaca TaxID=285545 RepID=UPI001479278E|nr:hypothetical protein [Kitasatospora atroaurantiaca]
MLDVQRHVVEYPSRPPAAHRRRIGTPKGSRAPGPFRQAVLVPRWFRLLAVLAPDVHKVLECGRRLP